MTNRRNFLVDSGKGIALLALASGSALFTTGCNVFNKIVAWLGVGIAATKSIINLLSGAGIVNTVQGVALSAVLDTIKAAFADVQAAVAAYENADPASKATFAGRISMALQALGDQFQKLWSDLNIPHASLASLVQGLIGIILSTIAGFQAQLPAPVSPPLSLSRRMAVVAQRRDEKRFRYDFNSLLAQSGQSQYSIQ